MASWQSPGLGPARPLTVTLAPRAQLGTRPGLGGRREPGPGLGREGLEAAEWAVDSRLAGQLLTWETCPTSPGGQGLNTLPRAPTAPPTATGGLPGTTALRARLGWVSVPFSVWGQHSLPGARESLCPWGRPWLGASLPTLAVCPPPPPLPGPPPLATPRPLPPRPYRLLEQGLRVCAPIGVPSLWPATGGRQVLPVSTVMPFTLQLLFPSSLLSSRSGGGWHSDLGGGDLRSWPSLLVCARRRGRPVCGFGVAEEWMGMCVVPSVYRD